MCPCQNDATNHAGSSSSTAGAAACWVIKLIINLRTAITQAGLPYYNRKDPQQGSKQARDSILKLLTGMNYDVQPLNFRSELKLNGDKDPYYPEAPAWSTLERISRAVKHAENPKSGVYGSPNRTRVWANRKMFTARRKVFK